jgi:hypothetical protein
MVTSKVKSKQWNTGKLPIPLSESEILVAKKSDGRYVYFRPSQYKGHWEILGTHLQLFKSGSVLEDWADNKIKWQVIDVEKLIELDLN